VKVEAFMGGYGSGWQGAKKLTVEESRVLTISSLMRKKGLVPGAWTSGSWCWTYEGADKPHATISYEADLTDQDDAWLRIHYWTGGQPVDYRVRLETTTPNYGGLRGWFLCPLVRSDGGPQRRVAKLYLPPGGRYFGSRERYGLTYTSCQESRKFDKLYATIAANLGTDARTIREALRRRGFS
jgi:hypothetical protein